MLLLMFWKIEPICGPSRISVPITTMATNAMINAYSMSPWPLDLANRRDMVYPPIFPNSQRDTQERRQYNAPPSQLQYTPLVSYVESRHDSPPAGNQGPVSSILAPCPARAVARRREGSPLHCRDAAACDACCLLDWCLSPLDGAG